MRKLLTVLIGIFLCTPPLPGSDAVTTISQDALTAYAASAGINTGSAEVTVNTYVWVYRCNEIQCSSNGPNGHGPCKCISGSWVQIPVVLWLQTVNWTVVSPAFVITPQGINFTGILANMTPGLPASSQAFTLPATPSFNASTSTLVLTVSSNTVNVPVTISGATYQVSVNLSPYYSIQMPLAPATLNVSGRNVSASLQNVSFQSGNGSLAISSDFSIH
jgi:hypothetical protein